MKKELPKQYDPKQVENQIYEMWMENGCFKAEVDPDKKPYSIVMPPPNVTGQLHMGHALDSTLQDILTRYKRMQGYSALWLPGTDHAGIATQIKVEEELRTKEGLTRYDLGREKFLERVWAWKEKYGSRNLLMTILVTALVTGLVQFIFFPQTALLGASGVVFMMIVLSSFTEMKKGGIPITLILVVVFYLGGELVDGLKNTDSISQLTHIVGGACGMSFGFTLRSRTAHGAACADGAAFSS